MSNSKYDEKIQDFHKAMTHYIDRLMENEINDNIEKYIKAWMMKNPEKTKQIIEECYISLRK